MEGTVRRGNRISFAIRFLGLLKQPDSDSSTLELEEGDVLWSADLSETHGSPESFHSSKKETNSPFSPARTLHLFASNTRRVRAFHPGRCDLSAALADENRSFMQHRKTAVDQIRYATHNAIPIGTASTLSRTSSNSCGNGGYTKQLAQSAPVNVPAWPKANQKALKFPEFMEEDEENEEWVPPHEMVARDLARSHVAGSVLEGVGRTLKGRDLRRVRTTIFRQTGFLES